MRFSLPSVAAGGLAALAVLTFADMALSQADSLRVDDAAILDAIEEAHESESALSELAIKKGSSQEMKDLAGAFLAAHQAGKKEVEELQSRLDLKKDRPADTAAPVPPTDTTRPMDPVPTRDSVMDPTRDTVAGPVPDSAAAARDTLSLTHDWTQPLDQLKASYKEQRKLVEGFDGKAFDRAWIEHQVAFHVNALENIKKVTPSAVNPEVKALLDKTQSSVQNHLQQARTLQSKMVATQ